MGCRKGPRYLAYVLRLWTAQGSAGKAARVEDALAPTAEDIKPRTDDVRQSAALRLIERLVRGGATVRATDPQARETAGAWLTCRGIARSIAIVADPYSACEGADAVVLATEWNEYRSPDFARVGRAMRGRRVYDGRNVLLPAAVTAAGLAYRGIGRPPPGRRCALRRSPPKRSSPAPPLPASAPGARSRR